LLILIDEHIRLDTRQDSSINLNKAMKEVMVQAQLMDHIHFTTYLNNKNLSYDRNSKSRLYTYSITFAENLIL